MVSQLEKADAFRALHSGQDAFVIPNARDAATAVLLTALGFRALATTSVGVAFSQGRKLMQDAVLANARAIAEASELPVSADVESGYAHAPEEAARALVLAAQAGAVGGSIEDSTGDPNRPIYEFSLAVERVAAAVEAVRRLSFPFTLTARAENSFNGLQDLGDTLHRLEAYAKAGADVLFAPALPGLKEIHTVCAALDKPVNVLADPHQKASVAELAEAGVKRISVCPLLNFIARGDCRQWPKGSRSPVSWWWFLGHECTAETKRPGRLSRLGAAAC